VTATLRDTRTADIFRLQEIERAAAELFRDSELIDIDTMAVIPMGDHITSIESGISICAELGGRIAGFVMGEMHGHIAYLRELDVDPAYQRRGIGAMLVTAYIEAARAKAATATYLSTFRDPPWNAPFYRRMGFTDIDRSAYLPWMTEMETAQAAFLDISTRVFMRRD
jgi:GNAT superfamily N-acetyltransferase